MSQVAVRWVLVLALACGGGTPPIEPVANSPADDLGRLVAEAKLLIEAAPPGAVTIRSGSAKPPVDSRPSPAIELLARGVCPGQPIGTYKNCRTLRGSTELVDKAWHLLGQEHFAANQLREAIGALEHVSPGSPDRVHARYLIAWSHYRGDALRLAIDAFEDVMRISAVDPKLRDEALQYLALSFTDPWQPDEVVPAKRGVERAIEYYQNRNESHVIEVFEKIGDGLVQIQEHAAAIDAYTHAIERWPSDVRVRSLIKKRIEALVVVRDALGRP